MLYQTILKVIAEEGPYTESYDISSSNEDRLVGAALLESSEGAVADMIVENAGFESVGPRIAKSLMGGEVEDDDVVQLLKDMAREFFLEDIQDKYDVIRVTLIDEAEDAL